MAAALTVAPRRAFGTGLLGAVRAGSAIFAGGLGTLAAAGATATAAATAAALTLAFTAGGTFAAGLIAAGRGGFGSAAEDAFEPADESAAFFGRGFGGGGARGVRLGGGGGGSGGGRGAATIATTVPAAFATIAAAALALGLAIAAATAVAVVATGVGRAFGPAFAGTQGFDFPGDDGLALDAENRAVAGGGGRSWGGGCRNRGGNRAGGLPAGGRPWSGGREDIELGLGRGGGGDELDVGFVFLNRSRRGGGLWSGGWSDGFR
jgi:hypothetical protein